MILQRNLSLAGVLCTRLACCGSASGEDELEKSDGGSKRILAFVLWRWMSRDGAENPKERSHVAYLILTKHMNIGVPFSSL